jgi:hypothetical protein
VSSKDLTKAAEGGTPSKLSAFLIPSLSDWVFVTLLGWLFFFAASASALLGDGDTGWHIRTGEHILATGQFPRQDLFSFTMEGRQWFAWEWLADVILAVAHQFGGLAGVSLLGGVVIAATAAAQLRYMQWLRVNVLVAVVALMIINGASSVHWLARPHMFTWGFFLATLWMLESDARRPSWRVYLLVPLVVLWTNIHGGFVAGLITIGIYGVGRTIEQLWEAYQVSWPQRGWVLPPAASRYGGLLLLCLAATLLNPYTYELHQHIFLYLQSDFILTHVQEFQSPNFRGESETMYEVALLLSVAASGLMLRRGEVARPLLILAWAHASLVSVRHMPLFMIVAVPFLARELTSWLEAGARTGNSWFKGLSDLAADYGGGRKTAAEARPALASWLGVAGVVALALVLQARQGQRLWTAEFPDIRFPALACDTFGEQLKGRRVLTMDQWGDYLIYRFYPEMKVFIDGRSDFYAPEIRDDYVGLLSSHWGWEKVLDRYGFDAALVPVDWSLGAALKLHPDWRLVYDDGFALLFERRP